MKAYINSGRIVGFTDHQLIAANPLAQSLQNFILSGDMHEFLDDLDANWDRVAKRRIWGIGATLK